MHATHFLRAAVLTLAATSGGAWAQTQDVGRIVVRYKNGTTGGLSAQAVAATMSQRATLMARRAGVRLKTLRTAGTRAAVYETRVAVDAQGLRALALKMAQDPAVLSAEPDVRVAASTNDPYFAMQWALGTPSAKAGAGNFAAAWPYSTGADTVVAVLDTGMTAHPDLESRQFAGHDFVSDTTIAADGGGRDADPTDPGDACASRGSVSSWHGTAVASQIAAIADNGYGIAGAAPGARIQQVRVLGKCGGWLSDTADAIAWLAGRSFGGIPAPSVRPQVINLSLGGSTSCPGYMQEAITLANAAGIVVVAAAGNEGASTISAPANCSGVIAVGAGTATGDLASYSNYSSQVAITAPGGGSCRQATAGCDTTATMASGVNGSNSFAGYAPARYFSGTSAATPHVAAAAALLLAYSPSLTPAQVRSALLSGVRPFPSGSFCRTAGRCGAGLLDAAGALWTLAAPLVTIAPVSGVTSASSGSTPADLVPRGGAVSLRASASTEGSYRFAWKQTSGSSVSQLTGTDADTLGFTAPATPGLLTFSASLTDAAGLVARNTVTLRVNSAPEALTGPLAAGYAGVAYQAALAARDGDGDTLAYALLSGPDGLTLTAGGALAWATPVEGEHTLKIGARDPYGQQTVSDLVLTIGAAPQAPTVPGGSFTARARTAFKGATGVTGPSGLAMRYALAGQPRGMTISSAGLLSWPSPVAGRYTITVTASNLGGSGAGSYVLTVGAANRAPTLAARSYAATARVAWSAQLQASDADRDTLSYALAGAVPSGFTLGSTGAMSWASPRGGRFTIPVRVSDGWGGATTVKMTLAVTDPNHAPTVTVRSYAAVAGAAWTGQVLAADADGDTLSYTLGAGAPAGLTVDANGLMSWAQPLRGSYNLALRVADTVDAAANVTLTLLVTTDNMAPSVAVARYTARAGVAWSGRVQASDPDGDKLVYKLSGTLPRGLGIDSGGLMRWSRPVRGTYVFRAVVTDSKGAAQFVPLTLVVS
ncbi:S8 family serine peptidase [Rubrivivax gelatinosus]|uniref:Serine protease n=1 Tax=Rubrivivax gelatinosus TaxID=28068 RepID=A0A4R2LW69_RUBGE|nr:S8 family serine peptidase [Rubrivivax gelatinosus]TCO97649.1 serine protease [Rubrivivax gelatinosus]